ncbi:serine/threonine-protein kinase VRK3 [Polymixia lowei]
MGFHFCPQCGTKLQPDFRFCPSCGEKLPSPVDASGSAAATSSFSVSTLRRDGIAKAAEKTSPPTGPPASNTTCHATEGPVCASSVLISTRPPLQKTRNSLRLVQKEKSPIKVTTLALDPSSKPVVGKLVKDDGLGSEVSPLKTVTFKGKEEPALEASPSPVSRSPAVKGKAKGAKRLRAGKQVEEEKKLTGRADRKEEEPVVDCVPSPVSSPIPRSPSTGKAKKAKRVSALKPLVEGEEVTDITDRKWRLGKLLSQSTTELIYEVTASNSKDSKHILKLGAKDGRIFNEQNFLQRAAKPSSVDKWKKRIKMDFLGIPSCTGFGLHADAYRFLIFPSMGQTLQSVMEDGQQLLSEEVVLQLACRILDVLEYIHSNEYVHADIHAENIYIKPGEQSQVFLVGYCHAFRYCPGGQHVEHREASRTLHEGAVEFISLDSHKGAGPSRRSDLQSLGYCMLCWHTGMLPWSALTNPDQIASEKQRYMENVPALLSCCFGKKKVSSALQGYLTEVMALQYSDQPDYTALKAGLHEALLQLGGSLEQPLSL